MSVRFGSGPVIPVSGYITEPMYRLKHRFGDGLTMVINQIRHIRWQLCTRHSLILQFLPGCLITTFHFTYTSKGPFYSRMIQFDGNLMELGYWLMVSGEDDVLVHISTTTHPIHMVLVSGRSYGSLLLDDSRFVEIELLVVKV